MTITQNGPKKRYGLFVLAFIILLSGIVVVIVQLAGFVQFNNPMVQPFSLLMLIVGAKLIDISNVHGLLDVVGLRGTNSQNPNPVISRPPGRLAWALGVTSAITGAVGYIYMYLDGYTQAWPLYTFAGSMAVGTVVWSYLVAKLLFK